MSLPETRTATLEPKPPETTAKISPVESLLHATSIWLIVSIFNGVAD